VSTVFTLASSLTPTAEKYLLSTEPPRSIHFQGKSTVSLNLILFNHIGIKERLQFVVSIAHTLNQSFSTIKY
jgi:hypothetical protein